MGSESLPRFFQNVDTVSNGGVLYPMERYRT
nr:MAG TPA: hypothetical protein [Caudoviricetes sp.]